MQKKRGNILIYAIFLANFAIIAAWILFSKSEILSQNIEYQNLNSKALKELKEKGVIAMRYDRSVNMDGSGFTNTVQCPQILFQEIPDSTVARIESDSIICATGSISLYYNPSFTAFSWGKSGNSSGTVVGTNPFTISFADGTSLTGSFATPLSNIDANMNSDDYTPYSTGTITYPNGYLDNDILGRTTAYGYIKKWLDYSNVFWNNTQTNRYVEKNKNNTSTMVAPLGQVDTGYLHFDVDNPWKLSIIEFDSGAYQSTKTLRKIHEEIFDFSSGSIGWLSNSGAILPGTAQSNNGLLKSFDFRNRNYAIFLYFPGNPSNPSIDFLKYQITSESASGSGVYLIPIDDSSPGIIKYLGNDIVVTSKNEYISKQLEIVESGDSSK